ncbi:MAG: flavodoxin [Eggerthellaceae bacterium]|nr:flavodoxin [Eggerthellaceae bacterium]
MGNIAVVYWSGTGNTEAMANLVKEGVESVGGSAELIQAIDFSSAQLDNFDAFAFGCPAMGNEELEDSEFEPMWNEVEPHLSGKRVALFGSYDWGTGEWMETWQQRALDVDADVMVTVVATLYPEGEAVEACKNLGAELAS